MKRSLTLIEYKKKNRCLLNNSITLKLMMTPIKSSAAFNMNRR